MKILLLAVLVFVATSKKSYSITTDEVEILESNGFRITNPPSDEGFWQEDENLKWRAFFIKPEATVDLLIPYTRINPESLQNFENAIDEYLNNPDIHPSLPPPASMIKNETATNCILQYGEPVRVIGSSEDGSMIPVTGHRYSTLSSYNCTSSDLFVLPRESLGKLSERGVDTSHIGQTVYYSKNFQWVKILRPWKDRFEWNPHKFLTIQQKRDSCNIEYGEPVKLLEISNDEQVALVSDQYSEGGASCEKESQFHLSTASIGKLIHYF